MDNHAKNYNEVLNFFGVEASIGLTEKQIIKNSEIYGKNKLSKAKKKNFFQKLLSALLEPMLLILLFGFVITLGINIGKYLKSGSADFLECFGILGAVILSVSITLIMEGSSEKAFNVLNSIYDNLSVKVIRNGEITIISQKDVVVGDVVVLESGDKIIADGRIIDSNSLQIDESALTGESNSIKKQHTVILNKSIPLAERINMVYSGTFVTGGQGLMVVTAIGDNTEIGKIAGQLSTEKNISSPLQQKLAKLGKTVTIIGVISAVLVFIMSIIRLAILGNVNFFAIQELFISCIVLIIAAVPEGLPTIVAISLALNMIKLAKENALIKKMIATETTGAVSIICSDKTGTLTLNQMSVNSVCLGEFCNKKNSKLQEELLQNFVCNSTADLIKKGNKILYKGNGTECALLDYVFKNEKEINYVEYRKRFNLLDRTPFSSKNKYMITVIESNGVKRTLVKGAPEKILEMCGLSFAKKERILQKMAEFQKQANRVLAFCHKDNNNAFVFDGFVSISDGIRKEVYKAIEDCKNAGIKIKMLTGDNTITALAIAKKLKIANSSFEVVEAKEIESLTDKELKKMLPKIKVIARSTPILKLRIVKLLKEMGEVVAVTGDGINDAPAIKHADVGISMGISGSEITKEASDIVLLDDSFSTIVKAIAFGRNVYKNLQRFILFQLSVNLSALIFIMIMTILGLPSPFNTFQLLWINVIMDGPPALTLGLEKSDNSLLKNKPIKRDNNIVSKNMLLRILFNAFYISLVLILQYFYNILCVNDSETISVIFTLFIVFQLFNAFNSRELGAKSIFNGIGKNKVMLITFAFTFLLQVIITQFGYSLFNVSPLSFLTWLKILTCGFSLILISELFKFFCRIKNYYKDF
ncbi:MAG: calcium-translocating P-type ATPase, PMCA-type [Clostridia bacterium]|nr:calcium-translocating P-type ATPase, PMCA-type [Clostridia bacterium]